MYMEVMAWRFVAGCGAAASREEASLACVRPGSGGEDSLSGLSGIAGIRRPVPKKGDREEEGLWER